jgi:D-alanyl-D-alanine carboxypeptidase/D-alanyl-D-alanine-endopeptidase (penicillin-binding protein 4)
MITEAGLNGTVGFAVADINTGEGLAAGHETVPLPPASVAKAVTALYALDALGADFQYKTRLLASGPIVDGVLNGHLVLAGAGNPNLLTDDLVALVATMQNAGLRAVTGGFYVWGGALPYIDEIDDTQLDHLGYNPSVSGLNLNYNRVHFEWRRANGAYNLSLDARSETQRPIVYTSRMRLVDRRLPVYTYEKRDRVDEWTVARSALGNAGSRWLPVRNPRLYAGDVFQTLARAKGVALANPQVILSLPDDATDIAAIQSIPLAVMMRDMLKYSTNITAEAAGLLATTQHSGDIRGLRTSALTMSRWVNQRAGVVTSFADHSGLSDQSAVSAGDMVRLLGTTGTPQILRPLMKNIPFTDANRRPIPGFPAEVRAKTGTLNFVTTLAGYLRTQSGRDLSFAIFAADLDARAIGKQSPDEQPRGAAAWNKRARRLQQRLLQHWAEAYDQPA